jgi:hypothetical protein
MHEEPCVWDGNRSLKLFQLSTGCIDQVYLALRIGLQDLFLGEESMPLLFDDAFVYFDEKRLERLLFYLKEQFPDKVPMGDVTPRELGFQQGIQWLIQHLHEVKKWSEEDNV